MIKVNEVRCALRAASRLAWSIGGMSLKRPPEGSGEDWRVHDEITAGNLDASALLVLSDRADFLFSTLDVKDEAQLAEIRTLCGTLNRFVQQQLDRVDGEKEPLVYHAWRTAATLFSRVAVEAKPKNIKVAVQRKTRRAGGGVSSPVDQIARMLFGGDPGHFFGSGPDED